MKDGRQRRAGIFDVGVDVAGQHRAIADQGAAEVQPAIHPEAGIAFDRLRQQLAEHELFGEIFRADHDRAAAPSRRRHTREHQHRGHHSRRAGHGTP